MKLTKQLEAEIRQLYELYWNSYINGDLKTYASLLDNSFKFIGSTEAEPLLNKKDSLQFLANTFEQLKGKAEFRNRKIKIEIKNDLVLINELCDGYILIGTDWTFYSRFRLSSLLQQKGRKWKFVHQHVSMPDSKAQEGESYGLELIRTENMQLREAVKRRTVELESKNRELEIEAALERVRVRTMAMQKSDELREAVLVIYQQLKLLHFETSACNIIIINKESNSAQYWVSGFSQEIFPVSYTVPYFNHPYQDALLKPWKQGDKYVVYEYAGKMKQNFDEIFFTQTDFKNVPAEAKNVMMGLKSVMLSTAFMTYGALQSLGAEPLSDENANILQRFAKVFEQTYTRFLDLQKAEGQAREAQIEAALERVRSRTMGMLKTDELLDTAELVHKELAALGINSMNVSFAFVDEDQKYGSYYSINPVDGRILPIPFVFPHTETNVMRSILTSWRNQEPINVMELSEKETLNHQTYIGGHIQHQMTKSNIPFSIADFLAISPKKAVLSTFNFSKGYLFNIASERLSKMQEELMLRFTRAFDQTYTRFLDLQKAEAQAREAEIELALERVRARTMGMQKPSEFTEVINVVGEQFLNLGFDIQWANFSANGLDASKGLDMWIFAVIPGLFRSADRLFIPYTQHPIFTFIEDALKDYRVTGRDFYVMTYDKEVKNSWLDHLQATTSYKDLPQELRAMDYDRPGYTNSAVVLKDTWLSIGKHDDHPFTDEQNAILKRFSVAFGQAYTRFLDLQKAEAQAREAEIELALERVRARTMAMQKSSELAEAAQLLYEEFRTLGIKTHLCGYLFFKEAQHKQTAWVTAPDGSLIPDFVDFPLEGDPVLDKRYSDWKQKKPLHVLELKGEANKEHHRFLASKVADPIANGIFSTIPDRIIFYCANFSAGYLFIIATEFLTSEEEEVIIRFAKVFELTYTRFSDLKQAEAQAKEARIEAALERVRSRSLAMHSPEELKGVALELRNQLGLLEQPELEVCAIQLYEESSDYFEAWGAVRPPGDEGKIIQVQVQFPKRGIKIVDEMFRQYNSGAQDYVLLNEGEKVPEWLNVLKERVPEGYEMVIQSLEGRRPEDTCAYWSMADFKGGSLVMTTYVPPSDDARKLLRRFANVFGLAYRRFIDLKNAEIQKREAQIELALERVRARTMAMHKSEELAETAQVLFQQLSELGGIPDRMAIGIPDEINGVVNFWTTDQQGSQLDHSFSARLTEKTTITKTYQAWKEQKKSLVIDLHGGELKEWIQFARDEMGIAVNDEQIKDRRVHSLAFFSHGWILVTSHEPQSTETIQILERFASVFNLSYRRFLDLQKAEAQAREAQIEAALEKVRSRSLAMHKSDELQEVVNTVFERLQELNMEMDSCNIAIFKERTRDYDYWIASHFQKRSASFHMPYVDLSLTRDLIAAKESGKEFSNKAYPFEIKNEWFDYAFKNTDFKFLSEERKQFIFNAPAITVAIAFSKHTGVQVNRYSTKLLTEEEAEILKRFAKVFEQAYIRFLDLEKAEAQARESELELALERVRAKSMSMRHSEELADLVNIVFKELTRIGFSVNACIIMTYDERTNDSTWWIANFDGLSNPIGLFIPNHSHEPYLAYLNEWKKQTTKWRYKLGGGEKKNWDQYLFNNSGLATLPDVVKQGMQSAEEVYLNVCFNKYASITFGSFDPMSDKDFDTLHRFAKVFEQSYTRFLDLKKAEAQVREAQIETALERVRARTMGMHQSKELHEVIETVTNQLLGLGLAFDNSVFCRINEDESWEMWMSTPQQSYPSVIYVPFLDHRIFHNLKEVKAKNLEFYTDVFEADEARLFFKHFFENTIAKDVPEERKQYVLSRSGMARSLFLTKDIWFVISRYSPDPFNDEENAILKRFAKVFEQAYIRFRDLEKAEAQANEARIEIALERIRARALAMHKSDELFEVAKVMREQMAILGQPELEASVVHLYEQDPHHILSWRAFRPTDSHSKIGYGYMAIPKNSCEAVREWLAKFYSEAKEYTLEMSGAKQEEWYDVMSRLAPDVVNSMRLEHSLHEKRYYRFSKFSGGALLMVSKQEPSSEAAYLQSRAAVVFDLAYRRFSDLQKAEAQAREAQIEAALERVRSKTMAMHNSNDLLEVTNTLSDQLIQLGFGKDETVSFITDSDEHGYNIWLANPGESLLRKFYVPRINDKTTEYYKEAIEQGKDFYTYVLTKEEKDVFFHNFFENTDLKSAPEEAKQATYNSPGMATTIVLLDKITLTKSNFRAIPYTEEQNAIIRRFAFVFQQSYTRFLDLQKAEAQAREAQIEASLERVRSKTMAMHNSEDVGETVALMFDELVKLGVETTRCGVGIMHDGYQMELWTAKSEDNGGVKLIKGTLDMKIHPLLTGVYESWIKKQKHYSYELKDGDLIDYYNAINNLPDYPIHYDINSLPSRVFQNTFGFNEGVLFAFTLHQLTAEALQIFKRFAGVFGQTYRRYLDLQKAEAQARESQIEASLERVRSKTMAMHNSQDVGETVSTMFDELVKLGVETVRCGIAIIDEAKTMEVWTASSKEDGNVKLIIGQLDMRNHPLFMQVYDAWKNKELVTTYELIGEDLKNYFRNINNSPDYPIRYDIESLPYRQSNTAFMFPEGSLFVFSQEPLVNETIQIFKRFAGLFGQTYRRYLDLQKAEAQAREAKIEASLERVRAKAMAMHKSEDLNAAVATVFEELDKLDLGVLRCGINIINKEKRSGDIWVTSLTDQGPAMQISGDESFDIHPLMQGAFEAWLKKEDFIYLLEGDDLTRYYKAVKAANFQLPESQSEFKKQYCYTTPYGAGGLFAFRETEFPEEAKTVMKRFAGVFDLTYKRFLDLQKAEANAREAQIEAGLERVRARTMAMHSSDDVSAATATMFIELEKLGIQNLRGGITIIRPDQTQEVWSITNLPDGTILRAIGVFDMRLHPLWQALFKAKENKESYDYYWLAGKDKEDYIAILNATPNYLGQPIKEIPDVHVQSYFFAEGGVWTNSLQPHTEDEKEVMKRFTSVFSLTFRRYQDLKKAEAQAREAQIEASLERVRARTMAMHSSEDVTSATGTMFEELKKLGIDNLRCGIANIHLNRTFDVFGVTNLASGNKMSGFGLFGMDEHPVWQRWFDSWKNKEEVFIAYLAGKEKEEYFDNINNHNNYLPQQIVNFPDNFFQAYYFEQGSVWTYSLSEHSESEKDIMKRFATSFQLTFRRYQDLQKAEAQAREATIEAALEKVRGQAMAMHNSNDLSVTTSMIISELRKLGIKPIRCGVGIINKETHEAQLYTARFSAEGDSLSVVGRVLLEGHPVLEMIYEKWLAGEDYFPELSGDSRRAYYEQLLAGLSVPLPDFKDEQKHYGHFFAISVGCLYAWSEVKYNDDDIKILKRFASIIDLTFRRYFELQKSEENAREAIKQAALDRIRADIASMRTINDLDRITPLIWNELTVLGIPFIRCGVFIMDEEPQLIHTFLSTPDGKAIAAFHLPYDTPGNISKVIDGWRHKKIYVDHWGEEEFIQFSDILMKQGALASREQYLKTIPKGGFHLHFLPFLQGMLYVGNTAQLNEEQIELIQHVADAFSTAYARYEDFNKLEAAKKQVENTLTELRQAQQQLVQSEKMASLGELTAGIAHEIQNPLNFVNNFSDVSNELLEEMKNELEKGNKEDAIAIVEDVRQNLEKILHHGKRADAIVKGMLQHSRMSSGQKEPTDINILADEYLRLAFHGLRAKDKTFNAKFETDFDNSIGKVNIIPQDIGRVVLNLINNAFYAVTEKKKQNTNGYDPVVTVTTKKENGRIEIKVKDNGNGIPHKVLDKIFQPFFTTKPTGQGTGLGLSLAYDIVTKGHSGELKVETKEGEGSEFSIQLPA